MVSILVVCANSVVVVLVVLVDVGYKSVVRVDSLAVVGIDPVSV